MRRAAARLGLLAAAALGLASLLPVPQRLPLAGPVADAGLEGFHSPEDTFRWTSGPATLRFPGALTRGRFRVELEVSAWRPRGDHPVPLSVSAGGHAVQALLTARPQTVRVTGAARGWDGDVVIALHSPTMRPGGSDPRALGVRLHRARLVPLGGALPLRLPPAAPWAAAVLTTVLVFAGLARLTSSERAGIRAASSVAVALTAAFAFARPWAVVASGPLAIVAACLAVLAWASPHALRNGLAVPAEAARALARAARTLAVWPTVAVAALAVAAVAVAHRNAPRVAVDLGSGTEVAVASRFGPADGEGGVSFREPLRGAELDLRDFGGGAAWTIEVTAAGTAPAGTHVLARAGSAELQAPLARGWETRAFDAQVPWGWRSGVQLTFPAAPVGAVRLDRVEVTRHGGLPSLRVVACAVLAALLVAVAVTAAGLPAMPALAAATAVAVGQALALGASAVAAIPFAPSFAGICALGALLAALLAGAGRRARAWDALSPPVCASAALAFMGWLTAAAYPLYRGGHFIYHSQIAEEIWRGKFLLFYLPFPGSILSRQEQWGNIVVPHPCLYHTVVSPLSALGRPLFHAAEKVLLALALVTMLLVAAHLARRLAGERAAVFAAIAFATLVPTYQVLGLGHLMMLFGVWAASLALGFVILRYEALPQPRAWLGAVLLLTLCFLSYTASLLFAATVVALASALLWRRSPEHARALAFAGVGASALAFGLYYVNWAWPFLTQSLPQIAGGPSGGGGGETWSRLGLQPGKLTYTYGSALVPLLGLGGLLVARQAPAHLRVLLLCWAAILPLVGGLDLFFNFLRKHHYFVMVPVAAGAGVLLAWLAQRPRWGRPAVAALGVAAAVLAVRMAADVALGRIP